MALGWCAQVSFDCIVCLGDGVFSLFVFYYCMCLFSCFIMFYYVSWVVFVCLCVCLFYFFIFVYNIVY